MRRPRPLQRLIDGRPDDSGRRINVRWVLLSGSAMILANIAGALVVFVLAGFVVPTPDFPDQDGARTWNLVAAAIYLTAALVIGVLWGFRLTRRVRRWLREERDPDERERRMILRAPLRLLLVNAALWTIGAAVFTVFNLTWSGGLAVIVFLTVALGGLTTSATTYLTMDGSPARSRPGRSPPAYRTAPCSRASRPAPSWRGRWAAPCPCSAWCWWRSPRCPVAT